MNLQDLEQLLPTPDLMDAKRVLCIQPHPDDIDVACGATVAKLAQAGAHITYLTVTDGGAGATERTDENQLATTRRKEQSQAGEILGVKNYLWLDYRDADYLDSAALQRDLINAIRTVRPDTVITIDPWLPYEAHPAHRTVGLCASAAVLFGGMGNIHPKSDATPHSVSSVAFAFTARPNTYIDVSETWTQKLAAIQSHKSQFPPEVWAFYSQYLEAKATQYGLETQSTHAEALKVFTPMHLHCNVDAEYL